MSDKPKPDDRRNNVDRIQYNINKTIQNCELADEMIAKTDETWLKQMMKKLRRTLRKKIKEENLLLSPWEKKSKMKQLINEMVINK